MARNADDITAAIIRGLDVIAEYKALGAQAAANAPGANGWLAVHAIGRDDGNPSAQINIFDGRYKDFGGDGDNLSLWDAAVKAGKFPTWQEARQHYADKAGVKLPSNRKTKRPDKDLAWLPWCEPLVALWCMRKPPITPEAILCNGGRLARYLDRYTVIALPVYPDGRLVEPCGWVLWNATGAELPCFHKGGDVTWEKMKTTYGSEKGWIGEWGLARIRDAKRAWKVEGPGDMLATWSIQTPAERETDIVVTNSGGANEHPAGPGLKLFAGKPCGVVHDCDIPGQDGATGSAERNKLGWAGAIARETECRNVVLPYPVAEKHGKDLRDYWSEGHAYGELIGLYAQSANIAAPPITSLEGPDDPHRLARIFLQSEYGSKDGVPILRFWLDEWYRWDGGAYRTVTDSEIRSSVTESIKVEFDRVNLVEQMDTQAEPVPTRKVTRWLVGDVLNALQGMCLLSGDVHSPSWIGLDGPWPADEIFSTSDRLLHMPSVVDDAIEDPTIACTPHFFTLNAAEYEYDPDPPEPKAWLEFLHSIWGEDEQSIEALQQWFGYSLLPDTRQHKVLFLVGPKRSGKGTIARMLEKLVGRKNVSNPTLGDLAGPFGLWSLVGRSLAIIGDARISQRSDTAQIVENLLSISGEDGKDVHRKNLPPLRNVRLNTRFVILSNELPNLRDASGALVSRLLLLQMRHSFYGKENKKLENKLSTELPGILTWAAHGWLKLHLRGSFIEPESSQELVREFERIASPVSAFVEDCLLVGSYTSRCCDVFDAWKEWCKENGREHPGSSNHLARELRAAIPLLDTIRPRSGEGRDRCFKGIAVRAGAFT